MKNQFRLTAWLLLMLGSNFFVSCSEDFLTKEPPGTAAGSVISSPDGVESVLVGTYAAMKGRVCSEAQWVLTGHMGASHLMIVTKELQQEI